MRVLSVILLLIGSVAESLKLTRVHVPHYKVSGEDATLECKYELGAELYAVKWYKDNEEFFRYLPRFNPSIRVHKVEGVHVDIVNSDRHKVVLKKVNVRSTGVYRCEASAEAPSFSSIMGEGRMTVVYLPKEGPQITGTLRDEYEVGDTLDLNCTSSKSFPPAKISWYINDIPIPSTHEPPYYETTSGETVSSIGSTGYIGGNGGGRMSSGKQYTVSNPVGLSSLIKATTRRLHLQLTPEHFDPKGTAKVRCVARIYPLFWQDGDEKTFSGGSGANSAIASSGGTVIGNNPYRDNRKTTILNEVDYPTSHDSAAPFGGHHHGNPNSNNKHLLLFYKREALIQIRGNCSKVLICAELLELGVLLVLILPVLFYP